MKRLLIAVLTAFMSLPVMAQEDALKDLPGYIDFGELTSVYGEPKVNITIGGTLLNFVGAMAAKEDPEAAGSSGFGHHRPGARLSFTLRFRAHGDREAPLRPQGSLVDPQGQGGATLRPTGKIEVPNAGPGSRQGRLSRGQDS